MRFFSAGLCVGDCAGGDALRLRGAGGGVVASPRTIRSGGVMGSCDPSGVALAGDGCTREFETLVGTAVRAGAGDAVIKLRGAEGTVSVRNHGKRRYLRFVGVIAAGACTSVC